MEGVSCSARAIQQFAKVGNVARCMPMVAISVLDSLALELYLKCLAVLDRGDHLQEHDYRLLVCDLPVSTQSELRDRWNAFLDRTGWRQQIEAFQSSNPVAAGVSAEFEATISHNARAFERWRYQQEYVGKEALPWTASPLLGLCRSAILQRQPEWAPLTHHIVPPETTFLIR